MDIMTSRGYTTFSSGQQQQDTVTGRQKDIHLEERLQQQEFPVIAPERATARGVLLTLFLAFGIFAVSAGSARFLFPRGSSGRVPATNVSAATVVSGTGGQAAQGENSLQRRSKFLSGSPLGPTWKSNKDCASSTDLPVLKGADVVEYFSLEKGDAAVYGLPENEVVIGGYRFFFASVENKQLFEERPWRYVPTWGAFCGWGIAMEDIWNAHNLGPEADPNSWIITPDGDLIIFRSEVPKAMFLANMEPNIEKGNYRWNSWFGDVAPGANGDGSPMNTACFCDYMDCKDA